VGVLPVEPFHPGEWKSYKGKIVKAPEASNPPWRVMVLQEKPIPIKNPRWKTIPISESGELQMAERSSFRCVYTAVEFRPWADEYMKSVAKWDLLRAVRCSSDGFRTYSQAWHQKTLGGDGVEVPGGPEQAELSLYDLIGGKPVTTTIILRSH
jgi:hypothetical protein